MLVLPSEELIKNLQTDPTNPEFHLQYANTWLLHTHETISQLFHSPTVIADLEFHFKEAIRLDPTNGFFKSEYALFLYHVKKEISSSYVFFEQAIRDSPQNALIRTEYAAILTSNLNRAERSSILLSLCFFFTQCYRQFDGSAAHFRTGITTLSVGIHLKTRT